jgi:hypothetical protein
MIKPMVLIKLEDVALITCVILSCLARTVDYTVNSYRPHCREEYPTTDLTASYTKARDELNETIADA